MISDRTGAPTGSLIRAVVRLMAEGLEQDASVLQFAASTYGEASAEALRRILAQEDGTDAATLAGLLLFPGEAQLAELEPLIEEAACTPGDADRVARAVEEARPAAVALLPGGERVAVPLEPGQASALVSRLRLPHTPPPLLADAITERFPASAGPAQWDLKSRLRHCRLQWTPDREAFLAALLARAPEESLREALDWAVRYLDALPPDAPAMERLAVKYFELATLLRRARDFHEALAKSSFEVMMAQGARVCLPHPDQVRAELALLDVVCRAVAGSPAWALAGMTETNLGAVEDGEQMIAALSRLGE